MILSMEGDSMGKALSEDLRYRLIKNVKAGMSARGAGKKLDIEARTATRIIRRWRQTGCFKACRRGGHKPYLLEPLRDFIEKLVTAHGDWSEAEFCAYIAQEKNVYVHPTSVGRFIRKAGWRYKKNAIRHRTRS